MREQIKWLWANMDKKLHGRHILALVISAVTSGMLLVNPALSQKLIDDVIVAKNPDPLIGILMIMLVAKLLREGLRYFMVITLGRTRRVLYIIFAASCSGGCNTTICGFSISIARAI